MKKNTIYILLVFCSFLIFILSVLVARNRLNNSSIQSPSPSISDLQEFKSSDLDFTVNYPHSFDIKEGVGGVILLNSGNELKISRHSTNHQNLTDYFRFLPNKPLDTLNNKRDLKINSYDSASGLIENRYIYYIYVDGWIYILSTSNPDLYSDLDQIAKSFRYIPD